MRNTQPAPRRHSHIHRRPFLHPSTSFPHPSTSFPRRRESIDGHICQTCKLPTAPLRAPNPPPSSYPQSPAHPKRRHQTHRQQNAAKCDRMRQNATKTRARPPAPPRARQRRSSFLSAQIAPRRLGHAPLPSFPHPPTSFPRRRESTAWTYRLESPSPSRHTNRPNGTP